MRALNLWRSPTLLRCGAASLAAVAIEFVTLSVLVSAFHVHYLPASAIASIVYLVVHFAMNRRWVFQAEVGPIAGQLARHVGVASCGNAGLIALSWCFIHGLRWPYQLAWASAGVVSFAAWTYPMSRYFTFRERGEAEPMVGAVDA